MIGLSLQNSSGAEISVEGDLCLEEKQMYCLRVPGADRIKLGHRELTQTGDLWLLPVEFWAGRSELVVHKGESAERLRVTVVPRPEKLEAKIWESLLLDLEQMLPGITVGGQGGELGEVGKVGVSLPLLTQALLPLVPSLLASLREILKEPRKHEVEEIVDAALHQTRRVERGAITWLSRHPEVAIHLAPPDGFSGAEPTVPVHIARDTFDHSVNRYVAWLCSRVVGSLTACAIAWRGRHTRDDDERAWCESRAAACESATHSIEKAVHASFLRHLRREPASDAALLVAVDDPRYARFQRQARRFLSPLFSTKSGSDAGAPSRATFDIYELWCFFAVNRAMRQALPGAFVSDVGLHHLLNGTGVGAKCVFRLISGRMVTIEFNPTFRSYWTRNSEENPSGKFSLSGERRPDLVLTASGGNEESVWLPLDAKYRVKKDALANAFESVHIYRDSLREPKHGGPASYAALLAPSKNPESSVWFSAAFLREHRCGVFEIRPGSEDLGRLSSWLCDVLRLNGSSRGERTAEAL